MGLILLLRDIALALLDALCGQPRRRYEHAVFIRAPARVVWDMLKSRDIQFQGRFPLRVVAEPVAGRPGVERVHILAGKISLTMMTRIVEERADRAILYLILPEGTDPALIEGYDDYVGFVLVEQPTGTRLDLVRETSPRNWMARLTIPIGLRSGGGRYKRKAEEMALDIASDAGRGRG